MNESVEINQTYGVPGRSKYEFGKLRIGGALITNDLSKYQQLRSAATRQGKLLKMKFSVRKVTEVKAGKKITKIAVVRVK